MKSKKTITGITILSLTLVGIATPALANDLTSLTTTVSPSKVGRVTSDTQEDLKKQREEIVQEIAKQQQIIKAAQAVGDTANKAVENQLSQGSVGFFKHVGSTRAAALFENKSYYTWDSTRFGRKNYPTDPPKDYIEHATQIGNPKDATSIENMYTAIEYAVEANRLRKELGLNELKFNDDLTARSQRNANWSSYATYHADDVEITNFVKSPLYRDDSAYGYEGENLAWGYSYTGVSNPRLNSPQGKRSPFFGWVFQERDTVWEEEIAKNKDIDKDGIIGPIAGWSRKENNPKHNITGHYLNFIVKDATLMGLASSTKDNTYGNCVALQIAVPLRTVQTPEQIAYTPAEYKKRLDDYVAYVRSSAADKVTQAQQNIKAAEGKLAELNAKLAEIDKQLGNSGSNSSTTPGGSGSNFGKPDTKPVIAFTDTATYPFVKEINWLASSGVTTGYPDRTFRPHDSVSRAAMAAFLYRLEGKPAYDAPARSPFKDIKPGDDFYKEICWLASKGITTGYADGTFRPWNPIARDAMAAFLHRYDTKVAAKKLATKLAAKNFTDTSATPFAGDIAWLSSTGVTTGYADGSFRPFENIERGAIAAFFYRMKH